MAPSILVSHYVIHSHIIRGKDVTILLLAIIHISLVFHFFDVINSLLSNMDISSFLLHHYTLNELKILHICM